MKKYLLIGSLALFAFACAGGGDKKNDELSAEAEKVVIEELQEIESATQEMIEEAEDISQQVDSLINNL